MKIDREWVAIARLARARGNKGELEAVPFGGSFERCRLLREVFLHGSVGAAEADRRAEVESVWRHGDRWVFKFRGVDSIEEAEPLAGAEVRIPASARPAAPPGEYYQTDLIGCEVVDHRTGRVLGVVAGWQDYGGPPLMEVEENGGRRFSVPFAASICAEIDLEKRRIRVDLPEGLAELESL